MITFATDIILVVRVPVLSLQITVVQPNVSTDGKDLTIALIRAILFVPSAKHLLEVKTMFCKEAGRYQPTTVEITTTFIGQIT